MIILSRCAVTTEFALSYSETNSQGSFGNWADYDSTNDRFYLASRNDATLVQFDAAGSVSNTFKVDSTLMEGVFVFTGGGKVWVYGYDTSKSYIISLDSDLVVEYNKLYDFEVKIGRSDGNNHGFFFGNINKEVVLLKIRESDNFPVIHRQYKHFNQLSYYLAALDLYATSASLLILISTNVFAAWTTALD